MLFYTNYDAICRSRGTSASAAAMAIGRSKGAASNWKSNSTLPKEDELVQLARHLNCCVSDFFLEPGQPPSAYARMMEGMAPEESGGAPALDGCEADFLEIYAACTKREKSELMAMLYGFAEEHGLDPDADR